MPYEEQRPRRAPRSKGGTTPGRRPGRLLHRIGFATAALLGLTSLVAAPASATQDEIRTDSRGLVLEGAPLIHSFDTARPGDSVEGRWTLTAHRQADFRFEGLFVPVGEVSMPLAEALVIEYGVGGDDGTATRWLPAGTLADPAPYSTVTGTSTMAGPGSATIPVRVTLADASALPPGLPQIVTANFELSYMAGASVDGSGYGPGLAASGAPSSLWLIPSLLAALAILLGLILRRREQPRDEADGPDPRPSRRPA